jgi:hypothetical protein
MTVNKPICIFCKHYDLITGGFTCKAFPDGIPNNYIDSIKFHLKPIKEQTGNYYFEPYEPPESLPAEIIALLKEIQYFK